MVERLHQRDKEKWKSICERLKMRETERDVQSRFDDIVSWIMVEQFVLATKKNERFYFITLRGKGRLNVKEKLRFCKFKKLRKGSFTNVKEWKVEYEREVGNKFNDSGIELLFFFFFLMEFGTNPNRLNFLSFRKVES